MVCKTARQSSRARQEKVGVLWMNYHGNRQLAIKRAKEQKQRSQNLFGDALRNAVSTIKTSVRQARNSLQS